MKRKLISIKRALFGGMAFVMAVTLVAPAQTAFATETDAQTEVDTQAEIGAQTEPDTQAEIDAQTETGAQTETDAKAAAEGNRTQTSDSEKTLREARLKLRNRTTGRADAMTVTKPVISDIEAPEAGKRLDDKALVTTAEKEQWQVPVLWVESDRQVASGKAVKGTNYLPVIAYVVPESYTIENTDNAANTYVLKLTKEVTKLYGDSRIITIYERNTGITYILPASLKDLFAGKAKDSGTSSVSGDSDSGSSDSGSACSAPEELGDGDNPSDEGQDKPAQDDKPGQDEKPGKEDEPEETPLQRLVRIHCNNTAQKSLSQDDLEYLADLIINKLQPQAINLLLASFPSFKKEASEGGIGEDIGLEIDYDAESGAYGYAINLPLTDQKQLGYYVSINAAKLTDDPKSKKPVVNRGGKDIIELANTMVHEFFHVFMYDYNRTGMLGMTTPAEEREVDGKTTEKYDKAHYPHWFIEGTASAVEHNWRSRTIEFSTLRREFTDEEQYRNLYDRELLLRRYVLGLDEKQSDGTTKNLLFYDIEYANGKDRSGNKVDNVGARYTAGYLATLYLCELSAKNHPQIGSSVRKTDDGVAFSSECLKNGLDNILARMHEGESLDSVIKDITGGRYKDTSDFEARFIKGELTDGYYYGDDDTLSFSVDFMNYMLRISRTEGRQNIANGSILFDFEQDFAIPLDPDKNATTNVLKVYDSKSYVYSTVNAQYAHTSGGRSVSGTPMRSNNASMPAQDGAAQSGGTAAGVAARESSALGSTDSAVTDVAARESSGLGSTDSAATGGTAKDMASEEASGASTGTTSSTEGASGTTTSGEVSENSSGASTAAASEQANEATSEGAPAASSGTASERASAASTGTASEQANKASDASTVKASEEASDSAADLSSTEE